MATKVKRLDVTYHRGLGGAHSEMGVYRTNPITGEVTYTVWRGNGVYGAHAKNITQQELVCTACGYEPDPWGYCHCGA